MMRNSHCFAVWPTLFVEDEISCPNYEACKEVGRGGGVDAVKASLHVNVWSIEDRVSAKREKLLEIGLMMFDQRCKKINILLPPGSKESVVDLSERMRDDDVINALFNADLSIEHSQNGACYKVRCEEDKSFKEKSIDEFSVVRFSDDDVSYKNTSEGVVVTIELGNYDCKKPVYFRCRFKSDVLESIIVTEKMPNALFQGFFSRVEIVDLRFNEPRLLKRSFREKMRREGEFKFDMIHVFYVCSSNEEVDACGKNYNGYRYLESSIWDRYIGYKNDVDSVNMLAHHWKMKANKEDFLSFASVLIRNTFSKGKRNSYILAGAGIVLISIIANILSPNWGPLDVLKYFSQYSIVIVKKEGSLTNVDAPVSTPSEHRE